MNVCSNLDSEGNAVAKIESELRVIEPCRNILKRMTKKLTMTLWEDISKKKKKKERKKR